MIQGMARTVSNLMTEAPMLVNPEDPLDLTESLMRRIHARHLPVVQDRSLVGIVSLRDLLTVHLPNDEGIHSNHYSELKARHVMRTTGIVAHPDDDLVTAAGIMNRHRLSCLPVVHEDGLVGIVTLDHFVEHVVMMLREEEAEVGIAPLVGRLMTYSPLATVQVHERVDLAQSMMKQYGVRHLPVMKADILVGMLSEQDILDGLRSSLDPASAILVGEIMTPAPQTTTPETEATAAGSLLVKKSIGALPVLRGKRLLGILSKSDFLSYLMAVAPSGNAIAQENVGMSLKTVLVVEDDAAILSSLAEVIREEGYVVDTAANGYQALARIETSEPDLIFLDLMLPQMDGWKFIAELRIRYPTRQTPIVLVSAVANLAAEASKLGVRYFLRKPFALEEVLRIAQDCSGYPLDMRPRADKPPVRPA